MRAAVIYKPGDVRVEENYKTPKPQKGEIMIKVRASGVCGTDISLYNGEHYANYPVIFGHEFAGEVIDLGEGKNIFEKGDRVSVDPNIFCDKCYYCRKGARHLCKNLQSAGIHIDGGFAQYVVIPTKNVYKIPHSVTFTNAAMAEPVSCCIRGIEMAKIKLGDTVLIHGAGAIGLIMLQLVLLSGAEKVIVNEPLRKRRNIALELGASCVIDPTKNDVEKKVKKITQEGAEVVIDCSGNLSVQERLISMTRRGGTVVLFGVAPKEGKISISPFQVNRNEITICGSLNNPDTLLTAIKLISGEKLNLDRLITHKLSLKDINKAFEIFGKEDPIKIQVVDF